MDWNQGRYRAASFRAFGMDRQHTLLAVSSQDGVVPVVGAVPFILSTCAVPRTLAGHERAVMERSSNADASFVRTTIESMVRAGLLLPEPGDDAERARPPDGRGIGTVAITTAERPQMLQRCLDSLIRHLDESGSRVAVLVVDGSVTASAGARGRASVLEAARKHGRVVGYIGQAEIDGLEDRLASAGAATSVLRHAMRGATAPPAKGAPTRGATSKGTLRNVVQLATAGDRVLMLDDDTVCTVWGPAEGADRGLALGGLAQGGLALCGHSDPREYRFFESRAAAMPAQPMTDADLIGAHERLLGARLNDLVARAGASCDAATACPHVLYTTADAISRARVRVTMTGVAGDPGLDCPYRLLLRDGGWKRELESSRDMFDAALTFCEVRRIAAIESVTHDPACELVGAAIDNTVLMPPFLPAGRDDGRLFGALVGVCDLDALFAHVPIGILHDSDHSWEQWTGPIVSASCVRLADILLAVLSKCHLPSWWSDAGDRMRRTGEYVQALAALPHEEFREVVRTLVVEQRSQELLRIDALLQDAGSCPDYWKAALRRYRTAVLEALERPSFYHPADIAPPPEAPGDLGAWQRSVGAFGELLRCWPGIWQAGTSLRAAEPSHATPDQQVTAGS